MKRTTAFKLIERLGFEWHDSNPVGFLSVGSRFGWFKDGLHAYVSGVLFENDPCIVTVSLESLPEIKTTITPRIKTITSIKKKLKKQLQSKIEALKEIENHFSI
jgi:hypothetical protein